MIQTQDKRRSQFILKRMLIWFLIMMSIAYIGDYSVEFLKEEPDFQSITKILYLTFPMRIMIILLSGFIISWSKWNSLSEFSNKK